MDKTQFIISSRKVIIRRKVASRPVLPCFTKDSIYIARKGKKEYSTMKLFYTRPSWPFLDRAWPFLLLPGLSQTESGPSYS